MPSRSPGRTLPMNDVQLGNRLKRGRAEKRLTPIKSGEFGRRVSQNNQHSAERGVNPVVQLALVLARTPGTTVESLFHLVPVGQKRCLSNLESARIPKPSTCSLRLIQNESTDTDLRAGSGRLLRRRIGASIRLSHVTVAGSVAAASLRFTRRSVLR